MLRSNYSDKEAKKSENSVGMSGKESVGKSPGKVEAMSNANFDTLKIPYPTFFTVNFFAYFNVLRI